VKGSEHAVASASHLAELEITGSDVVAAWNALEPAVAQCAGSLGSPVTKSNYRVGQSDDDAGVGGADLPDCLDRVDNPALISVTYTTRDSSDPEPRSIELRLMRYRRFKELSVHLRVAGPQNLQTLGLFDRTEKALVEAIGRFSEP
jgi:hypothetical protein